MQEVSVSKQEPSLKKLEVVTQESSIKGSIATQVLLALLSNFLEEKYLNTQVLKELITCLHKDMQHI